MPFFRRHEGGKDKTVAFPNLQSKGETAIELRGIFRNFSKYVFLYRQCSPKMSGKSGIFSHPSYFSNSFLGALQKRLPQTSSANRESGRGNRESGELFSVLVALPSPCRPALAVILAFAARFAAQKESTEPV